MLCVSHALCLTCSVSRPVEAGDGELRYPDGSSFIGRFIDDKKVGHGEFVDGVRSTNGSEISYTGNYVGGVRHGDAAEWEGVYGDVYVGARRRASKPGLWSPAGRC